MKLWFRRSGRETFAAALVLLGLTISMGRLTSGCALFTPQNAKTALQISEVACVLYNAEASKPLPAIMEVCKIDQVLAPEVEKLLAAKKQEGAMLRAAAADGGAP